MTEDEMVGWHHQLNGHEFEQALGEGERQGRLACCSPVAVTVAVKSLQLCPTLCDPMDCSPPGSSALGFPGKNTGVGCHCLLQCCSPGGRKESDVTE